MHQGLMVRNTVSSRSCFKIKTPTEKEIKSVLFKISTCRAMHSCPHGTGTKVMRTTYGVAICFRPLFLSNHHPKTQSLKTTAISDFPRSCGWLGRSSASFTGLAQMTTFAGESLRSGGWCRPWAGQPGLSSSRRLH